MGAGGRAGACCRALKRSHGGSKVQEPAAPDREEAVSLARVAKAALLAALALLAAVSCARGFYNALSHSQDFAWSPARVLLEGDNPYEEYLGGDAQGRLLLSQSPNYAHGLYVLMLPLAALPFGVAKIVWALFNIAAGVLAPVILSRAFRLPVFQTGVVVTVFLMSTPFRNALGNGQQTLLVLLALIAPFALDFRGKSIVQGFGYLKYSFAPPFFFHALAAGGVARAALTLIPGCAGFLVFYALCGGGDLVRVALGPLLVNQTAMGLGSGDLLTLITMASGGSSALPVLALKYGLVLAVCAGVAFAVARAHASPTHALAILSLCALVSFPHHNYDWVFLLPVLCLGVAQRSTRLGKALLGLVAFNWFALKLLRDATGLDAWAGYEEAVVFATFAFAAACLAALLVQAHRSGQGAGTAVRPAGLETAAGP